MAAALKLWAETACDWTSVHGLVWYTRIDSPLVKGVCICVAVVIIIGLPVFLAQQTIDFASTKSVLNSFDFITADSLPYPNVTVCHPRFFALDKMEGNKIKKWPQKPSTNKACLVLS